jgi:hypothetical protein
LPYAHIGTRLLSQEAKLRVLMDKTALANSFRQHQRAQKDYEKDQTHISIKDKLVLFKLGHLESKLEKQFGVRSLEVSLIRSLPVCESKHPFASSLLLRFCSFSQLPPFVFANLISFSSAKRKSTAYKHNHVVPIIERITYSFFQCN